MSTNKALGQHWLKDRLILEAIADCAELKLTDTVLEIGPGLGTLTSVLLDRVDNVVAVEFDEELARKLPGQFPGKSLTVKNEDILSFNLQSLPDDYVVVANLPYYITSKIIHVLINCSNPPKLMAVLVQKEVAERLAAEPGAMSILAISAQLSYDVSLGPIVGREWFTPPPKVDSRVVVMRRKEQPLVPTVEQKAFFRVVKAGFSERRKQLRSSLSGGLAISKSQADELIALSGLSPGARAQELSLSEWQTVTKQLDTMK